MDEKPDDVTTPNPDGGDAGTQDEAARNAEAEANREKLLQTLQEKAARVNAAEAEAKVYKAQLDALTRAQSPAARGGDPRAERLSTVQQFATGALGEGPDPVAAEVLALREELSMTVQELANVRALDRITDEAKQQKVKDHFNKNRHRLGDVEAARAEIEREELSERAKEQQAEIDRLKATLAATSKRTNPDVVQTHTREVTAAEQQSREMTKAQWDERQAQLEAAAQAGDAEARRIRTREQVQRANGQINVKYS